jgi:D-amino-acid oxidase
MRIAVVGAGIIGLTTALALAERGHEVRIVAEDPPDRTTSATAGAIWGPYRAGPAPAVDRWSLVSLAVFTELAGAPGTGVRMGTGVEAADAPAQPPRWHRYLSGWRPCDPGELPPGAAVGWRFTVPMIDMTRHLPYLAGRLATAGVRIQVSRVRRLDDVGHAQMIVNCTGHGARDLVPDPELVPVRGQHVVVGNPGITEFLMVDVGASTELIGVYPHVDRVVLGGTAVPGAADRTPDPVAARQIVERCARYVAGLADAPVLAHQVGIRPVRPAVRLEAGRLGSGRWVIHNYGHGGAGVTLCWGVAAEVADLAEELARG